MAYDEGLAQRIRDILIDRHDVVEKKMFGGLTFMVSGHMCCGVMSDGLMVRVGLEQYEDALAQPGAHKMDFTKRPMRGMVKVSADGFDLDEDLQNWVDRGLKFVTSLPPR